MTWTTARDFDFYVVASDSDYLYRNADRMSAPGGETYTMSALHGNEMLLAYAYFFSNDVTMSTAAPTVTFSYGETTFDTVSYSGSDLSGYRYWLAACFDSYGNISVIN